MGLKVLITGARGFIGTALLAGLRRQDIQIIAHTTSAIPEENSNPEMQWVSIKPFETERWNQVLSEVDIVIHLAARVHVMEDLPEDSLNEYRAINVDQTKALAMMAAQQGVRRFVYVSSIKVNGEETCNGMKFNEAVPPMPRDAYGISKWEAEQALGRISGETGMEVVIVRPPLVYGAGVKGNFFTMLSVVAKGIPLPFASLNNRRSLIYVGNLVDALMACMTHPAAAGQTYMVSDGDDVSTPELLRQLAGALGIQSRLFPCPQALLRFAGRIAGKSLQVGRLLGSLEVDSAKIRRDLNWVPPYSLQHGLRATADWYRNQQRT